MAEERKLLDITPFVAVALARNERAFARIRDAYYERPVECESALYRNHHYRHEAISSCRSEIQIKARQALGVIYTCGERIVLDAIKRGWPQVTRLVKNNVDVSHAFSGREIEDDSEAMDLIVVAAYYAKQSGRPIRQEMVQSILILHDMYSHRADFIIDSKSVDIDAGKRAFPNGKRSGAMAIEDAEGDNELVSAICQLGDAKGIFLSDYLSGVRLTEVDKAVAVAVAGEDKELIPMLGLMSLMYSAIKADNAFMLENHQETIKTELAKATHNVAAAKDELSRAEEKLKALEQQYNSVIDQAEKLKAQVGKLQSEIDKHTGDAQELSSLRNALYAAEQEDTPPIDITNETGTIAEDLRIVCMGGHQRWIAQMKKSLPQINYVPADVSLNEQILRNADAVWFRADYISHKFFTPAIAICRSEDIPVFYFSSRGAERCIAEIIKTMNEFKPNR